MRFVNAVLLCFTAFCLCLSCGSFVVSATTVEDPTVSPTEVVVSDPVDPTQSTEFGDSTDPTPVNSALALAAVTESEFDGFSTWSLSTNLGAITLVAPKDIDSSGIRIVNGSLVNYNNSTVYFFCPEFPSYTFSASRFAPVYYRSDSGYNSTLLTINSIEIDSIDFLDYYEYIVIGIILCILIFILWRCIFR